MPASGPLASSRRRYLRGVGATLGAVGVAGCSEVVDHVPPYRAGGDAANPSPARSPTASPSGTPTGTATGGSTSTGTGGSTGTSTATPIFPGYDTTEVRVRTPDGALLGAVTAAIADTPELRYTGLSDTESLPPDRGMLFVYDEVDDHTFVMRRMDFGIDIVYADDEGVITRIHHAPAPGPDEDGSEQHYPGRGQYVLEVNYEWTTAHGVETGDVLAFEL